MKNIFHKIDRDTWDRNVYFDYYYNKIKCKYNLNANIDITELLLYKEIHRIKFFPTMLYIIIRAVNQNREFRMSFDSNNELGYWDEVVPCYTIFHSHNHTFTDIWSEYSEEFKTFYDTVLGDIERYRHITGVIKARPNQPQNFCPISCLPWLSFTGFAQDTYTESAFLSPIIKFGKYFSQNNRVLIPLAISVHHSVADGYHTCKLINEIQEIASNPQKWLGDE